ncbi:kinase-like protein [Coccomyxa subellipsoidea C-169]|uniref:Kinase-like protein n=1 Tax=Coccomyxa subellipsoidea (strain C-169) TaxID=574566 RepID=I0Z8F2_COCSC|nr:kinase-like protein [Coccomyxa subellipsoidea C-169]EIE26921.1 kinase-like protein [Coccomyxa subellipsoidea C-169]|eukprot:XP_005651465.1 kinase-like protein [Coccomyxa subellipsoidea C-169]
MGPSTGTPYRCYVNPMTCQHKPFLSNNGQVSAAWDACMDPGMNTTIDAEKTINYCSCMSSYNYTTVNGTVFKSDGGCIQDDVNIPPWCLVVEKSCSQPPPKKPNGQAYDICRGTEYDIRQASATLPTGPALPRPETPTGCQCLANWNYTTPGSNQTSYFNGTCGTPGIKSAGPWCYVDKNTCSHQPIADQSGLYYDNCANVTSNHTMDTSKTVNYCNCQPVYNYTAADGVAYSVTNGSCIRTTPSELPWCYVVEDTCITPVLHREGLGRNDSAWDTCLTTGESLSYIPPPGVGSASSASAGVNRKLALAIGIPCAVAFVLLHIPLCWGLYILLQRRRTKKKEEDKKAEGLLERPWGQDVLQAYMDKQYGDGSKDDEHGSGGKIVAGMPPANGSTAHSNGTNGTNGSSETVGLISGRKASRQLSAASSLPEVVPSSSWEIKPSEIVICKHPDGSDWEIGSGGFGKVYKAQWNDYQQVAVKQLKQHDARNDIRFLREIAILKECRSTNVVQFLGACVAPGSTMLVCELMEGGSVSDLIRSGQLVWSEGGLDIGLDVARGLSYLHNNRIAHLDIKSGNVLLTREGKAKIADVGLAQMVQNTHISNLNGMGTFAYAAPELLTGGKCNEHADIFSFGVLLWELVTGEIPRRGKLRELRVGEECTQEVADLLDICMRTNVEERPSAKELVAVLQALPPQPNNRPKRAASAQSFVSPLDRAAHSDDSSSTLGHSTNSSKSASGFNFYQGNTAGYSDSMPSSGTLPLIREQDTSPFVNGGTASHVTEVHTDELPVSSDPSAPVEKNPATDALEAAKALEAAEQEEAARQEEAAPATEPKA